MIIYPKKKPTDLKARAEQDEIVHEVVALENQSNFDFNEGVDEVRELNKDKKGTKCSTQ